MSDEKQPGEKPPRKDAPLNAPGPSEPPLRRTTTKLARKLVVVIGIVLVSLFAVSAYLGVQREVELFENDMRHDHEVLGAVLEKAVATTWRQSGRDAAMNVLAELSGGSNQRIRWSDELHP